MQTRSELLFGKDRENDRILENSFRIVADNLTLESEQDRSRVVTNGRNGFRQLATVEQVAQSAPGTQPVYSTVHFNFNYTLHIATLYSARPSAIPCLQQVCEECFICQRQTRQKGKK